MRIVGRPDYGLLAQLLWVTIVRAHWLVGSMWHSSHKAQKSRRVMYLIIQRRRETGRIPKPETTTTNHMAHVVCLCLIQPISNQVSLLTCSMFVLNYLPLTQLFNHLNNTQVLITFE